ncbi:hypothetical protein ES703_85277 [subsurface metagenome]
MAKAQLAVTLYMETQVLTGFIYQPKEERLSDLLVGVAKVFSEYKLDDLFYVQRRDYD